MKKLLYLIIPMACFINAIGQTAADENNKKTCPAFDPTMWETPSRDLLRQELVALTGPLKGKTVLDIGAGSGYFTFEFAKHSGKVIATELDQRFLEYIAEKKLSLNLTNVETRLATGTQDELKNLMNVDITLMVFVYHFLDDPKMFLTKLKNGMSKGGQIIIVNGENFSPRFITDYLEATGFKDVSVKKFTLNGNCGPEKLNIVWAKKQ